MPRWDQLLEEGSNEKSERPADRITKTNKIIVCASIEIVLGDEHSFITIQAYLPWALAHQISRS